MLGPETSRPRAEGPEVLLLVVGTERACEQLLGTRRCSFLRLTRLKGKPATQMEIQMFGRCFVLPPRARCWLSLSGDSTAGRWAPARASCQSHGPF